VFCDYRIHPYINSILFVSITFTVVTTKLWKSNYSPYQEELYKKICDFKDDIGYGFFLGDRERDKERKADGRD